MIPSKRLKYSGKSFGLANGWKKWIGEIQSLDNMNGVEQKEAFEKAFMAWVQAEPARTQKYGKILDQYAEIYDRYVEYYLVNIYTTEVFGSSGAESVNLAGGFRRAVEMATQQSPDLGKELQRLQDICGELFQEL